jgi:hypothetical protein
LQVRPSPVGQLVHWAPPTPQTGGVLARQRPGLLGPLSQQPVHWPGRQTQTWPKHWAPAPHATQASPPPPQKSSTLPFRQMEAPNSEKQQPSGQLCPSQTHWPAALQRRPTPVWQGGLHETHCWSRHPSPEAQTAQAAPPVPQAWMVSPDWHVPGLPGPSEQQPSGQLCRVQTHCPLSSQAWPA